MRILKISAITIISLSLIAYFSSDYFIEQKLKKELTQIINNDSLSYYNFSIEKLDLSIITGSVTIIGVKVTPTQEALDSLKSNTNNVRVLVTLSCDRIKMKKFEIKHFLRTQELIIDEFIIEKPSFSYVFNGNKKSNSETLALNNLFSDSFKKAELKKFIIDKALMQVKNIQNENPLVKIENFNFKLTVYHYNDIFFE